MEPQDPKQWGPYRVWDLFSPALAWNDPIDRMKQGIWVDADTNLVQCLWAVNLTNEADRTHYEALMKGYQGPTPRHWQRCRIMFIQPDDHLEPEIEVVILRDPRLVQLGDEDFQYYMSDLGTDQPEEIESAMIRRVEKGND